MTSYMLMLFTIVMTSFVVNANPNPSPCAGGYFLCRNENSCIPEEWWCDGERDCQGGEDEVPGCADDRECENGYFACDDDRRCIPMAWRCDADYDCEDKADEAGCSSHSDGWADGYRVVRRRRRHLLGGILNRNT